MRIAVITEEKSDFSLCLERAFDITYINPKAVTAYNLDDFKAVCILGGTGENPLAFMPNGRILLEKQLAKGQRFFCEYTASIKNSYVIRGKESRFLRLLYVGDNVALSGTLLDDQCNTFTPSVFSESNARPVMVYKSNPGVHAHMDVTEESDNRREYALWYNGENLLVCNFRFCNFIKARFSPRKKWRVIAEDIMFWLTGTRVTVTEEEYTFHARAGKESLMQCVQDAASWFRNADIVLDGGKNGVREGLTTEISPEGNQRIAETVRTDCAGEASLAFYTTYLLTGDENSRQISDALTDFCFELMQIKEGPLAGMMRWNANAWGVCYQDDVARVLVSAFLKMLYSGKYDHIKDCRAALDFLLMTTGSDGLRVKKTYNINLTPEEIRNLSQKPSAFYSAHHNAYYMAALLMYGKLTGETYYIEAGEKGLLKLMEVYPNTIREHSETQEMCRLILPLAWLWYCTKNPRDLEYLYTVCRDLEKTGHESGAFLEYDTGYKAMRSRKIGDECSLLMENGDPVVDMLYSLNWLPMAFTQAYFITKDVYFLKLWEKVSLFGARSQIQSSNKKIHGAWARCFDVQEWDVYGTPNDVDWGPWCVESGWTVSNMISGIGQGLLAEKLATKYTACPNAD